MIRTRLILAAAMLTLGIGRASAVELRMTCYNDGNECQVTDELLKAYTAKNPEIAVKVDVVPYKAILESLPVQLAAGQAPDMARVTDLGGLHRYYLDVAPYVDRAYWEQHFGDTLPWYRQGPDDHGIYGLMSQLTVTGGYANKTLFDQAGVPLPGPQATWDDWAAAATKVAKATETPFPMAMDRSGQRFGGPAISYGAKYFTADGKPQVVDAGFKAFATKFVGWNKDGTMDKDVWAGQGGATYQDALQQFINARLVFYYSGSWQVARLTKAVGDGFDWAAVGNPCGPTACSGMPGGAGFVGFKSTKHPAEVGKVMAYLASAEVYERLIAQTRNVPADEILAKKNLQYPGVSPQGQAALEVFTKSISKISPVAYQYQGYRYNRAMYNATVARLTQAIVGELTLAETFDRIDKDVAEAVTAAK